MKQNEEDKAADTALWLQWAEDSGANCGNLGLLSWVLGPWRCLRLVGKAHGEERGMEPQTGVSQWEAANLATQWPWARTA